MFSGVKGHKGRNIIIWITCFNVINKKGLMDNGNI